MAAAARLGATRIDQLEDRWQDGLLAMLGDDLLARVHEPENLNPDELQTYHQALGHLTLTDAYRSLFLSVGDRLWVEYLTQMEALRTSIGLEAYGQRDPLVQYKSRAFDMFGQLLGDIRAGIVSRVFRVQPAGRSQPETIQEQAAPKQVQEGGTKKKKRRRRRQR